MDPDLKLILNEFKPDPVEYNELLQLLVPKIEENKKREALIEKEKQKSQNSIKIIKKFKFI